MRYLPLFCLPLAAAAALAQAPAFSPATAPSPATSLPVDPLAESRRIDEEMRKLSETDPTAIKLTKLSEKISEIEGRRNKDNAEFYAEIEKIRESPEYAEYEKKQAELSAKRRDKWDIERAAMAAAAKKLYAARHDELRAAPPAIPNGKALNFDVLSFPRIDGSTSTHPLNVIVASRLLGITYEWSYPEPRGYVWHDYPVMPQQYFLDFGSGGGYARESYEFSLAASRCVAVPITPASTAQTRTAMMVNSLLAANSNTHDAYVNLIEGKCDLNLSARPPSASELKLALEKKVTLAYKPIAHDAMVFIAHHSNPVKSLTTRQLRDIYFGKIKTWREVATDPKQIDAWQPERKPEDKIIRPLRREPDSGSRELFDALLMKGEQLPEPESKYAAQVYASSMSGPYNRVTQEPSALAYSVYYYEHFMALSAFTQTLAVDGVPPSAETIASGKYPLSCPVYLVYRASDAADSPRIKLMNWLLSPEGQAVIKESGYVPAK